MTKDQLSTKLKKLKHVQVYNQIFHLIQDGTFPPGMQLPSEPELAEQLNVSRMTLRKSLALLQEDHLVKNIRGKGNFVRELNNYANHAGMETLQHPIKACCNVDIEKVEIEFRIEVPSEAISAAIQQETPVVIIADRWYHLSDNTKAYTLSFIPVDVISQFNINLNHLDELNSFLEEKLYQPGNASHSQTEFCFTKAGNFTATKYILSEHGDFMLIQESIFKGEKMLVQNKHYIPIECFEMHLNSQYFDTKTY
ncbi:GntR family transcriptional regulator [Streptococcus urinalis]|uniref:Bacterial regulatory protein, GntR family n=1 Tax=Streptococcus urinalis 2285-97 TaxID=764291 RepID=G5KID3_9STRE|nr:GntR family transcriptional regulator [Streptococcus urinalis]EHJ55825.1 bacterial regulatory protein, GntR family [Streptococcus urinalis 2285-97]